MPLKPEALEKDGLVQFPTVIGGEVIVVNLPGIKSGEIRLTGPVLADIFLGKILKWNDKALADLNPKVQLPDSAIAVVRRADGSGTTFIFTNYLSKVSDEWKQKVGEGTAVQWPVGLGGKGNEGVSAFVQRIPGAGAGHRLGPVEQTRQPSRAGLCGRRGVAGQRPGGSAARRVGGIRARPAERDRGEHPVAIAHRAHAVHRRGPGCGCAQPHAGRHSRGERGIRSDAALGFARIHNSAVDLRKFMDSVASRSASLGVVGQRIEN